MLHNFPRNARNALKLMKNAKKHFFDEKKKTPGDSHPQDNPAKFERRARTGRHPFLSGRTDGMTDGRNGAIAICSATLSRGA